MTSGDLRELNEETCVARLRHCRFGRLALGIDGWPAVLPVNYVWDDDSVVVRTGAGGKLEHAPMSMVAFEVDSVGPHGEWGWSVLVQGPAFDITTADDPESRHLRSLPLAPWPAGQFDHWLKISALRISGRSYGDPSPESGA